MTSGAFVRSLSCEKRALRRASGKKCADAEAASRHSQNPGGREDSLFAHDVFHDVAVPFGRRAPAILGDDQDSQGSQRWADVDEDLASVETVTPSSGQSTSSHGSSEAPPPARLPPRPPAPVRHPRARAPAPWEAPLVGVSGSDYRSKLRAGGQEALQRTMAGMAQASPMLPAGACSQSEHVPMFTGPVTSPHAHMGGPEGFYGGYSPASYGAEQYFDAYSPMAAMSPPHAMQAPYGEQCYAPYGAQYQNSVPPAPQCATSCWGGSPTAVAALPAPQTYSAPAAGNGGLPALTACRQAPAFGGISDEVAAMTTALPQISGMSNEQLAEVLRASAEAVYED